jgi:hypothetical protein
MPEQRALESWLARNQKSRAFRHEGVTVTVTAEQLQANKSIEDRFEPAGRSARGVGQFVQRAPALVQVIEKAVFHRRLDDQRWSVAPGHLHDAVGSRRVRRFHQRFLSLTGNSALTRSQ